MPTGPASTADDITDNIRTLIDRMVDAKFTQEMAKRGTDAWRDSGPLRRDAAKALSQATDEAAKWSDTTWRTSLRPLLKELWSRRTLAIGAAGAAVPAGRELVDTAAARLGVRERRERRHWGAFFLGLLVGAAAGAIAAMLTTPKPGSEMRRELTTRADELAAKAKDDWVPIFERAATGNGHVEDAISDISEGAADAGTTAGETADAITETAEPVDRESPA